MLYIIFQKCMSMEEAANKTGRKFSRIPDNDFEFKSRAFDLNNDDFFKMCLLRVGNRTVPCPNVVRDELTGLTYSFDKVSTGVKSLWLMNNFNNELILESCYFGPNCYKILVEISRDKDVYIYDNSGMMVRREANNCIGYFTDVTTGNVIEFGNDRQLDYIEEMGY